MYRILLLEDDPDDQLLIEMLLEDFRDVEIRVDKVTGIADARAHLEARHYDLLIVDWLLQGRNGTEYGSEFIKIWAAHRPQAPAILISGQTHVLLDSEILGLISKGQLQYINKGDLTPYVIVDAICNALSRVVNVLVADRRPILPLRICATLNADRFYRFRPAIVHDCAAALSMLRERVFDVAVLHAQLPNPGGSGNSIAAEIDRLLQRGACEDTAFILYGFAGSVGADETALRLLGRRHINFCSEAHVATPAIVPSVIDARNTLLNHRHYHAAAEGTVGVTA